MSSEVYPKELYVKYCHDDFDVCDYWFDAKDEESLSMLNSELGRETYIREDCVPHWNKNVAEIPLKTDNFILCSCRNEETYYCFVEDDGTIVDNHTMETIDRENIEEWIMIPNE